MCFLFCEVYRYLKTGNGKSINYGLRNPKKILRIDAYEIPSDEELIRQEIEKIVCETCFLREQCYGMCLLSRGAKKVMIDDLFKSVRIK